MDTTVRCTHVYWETKHLLQSKGVFFLFAELNDGEKRHGDPLNTYIHITPDDMIVYNQEWQIQERIRTGD